MNWIIPDLLAVEHVLNWPRDVLDNYFYCSTGIIYSGVRCWVDDHADDDNPDIQKAIDILKVYLDGRATLLDSLCNDETRELINVMQSIKINEFSQDDLTIEELKRIKEIFSIADSSDEKYNLTFDSNKFNKVMDQLTAITDTDDESISNAANECRAIMERNAKFFKNGKARLDTYTPLLRLRRNGSSLLPLRYAVDFAYECKEKNMSPSQWRKL